MSAGFDADWLALRAPYDAAAAKGRASTALARHFGRHVRSRRAAGPLRLIDLGGGTGANVCRLAQHVPGDQIWYIVDRDRALLDLIEPTITAWADGLGATARSIVDGVVVTTPARDITLLRHPHDLCGGLDGLPLADADGVAASALLDLVSADWLETATAMLCSKRLPALFTLNFDGRMTWNPPLRQDSAIVDAFRRDLRRDKGFGRALGDTAPEHLLRACTASGYAVQRAPADWHLGEIDVAMHQAMLEFVGPAAAVNPPEGMTAKAWSREVASWSSMRSGQIEARSLRLNVGHTDLLAHL